MMHLVEQINIIALDHVCSKTLINKLKQVFVKEMLFLQGSPPCFSPPTQYSDSPES